jgi:hypothetical protein
MVRDLVGTVSQQRAEMGIPITLDEPKRGMTEVRGVHQRVTGQAYPKVQIITTEQLLTGKRPKMPQSCRT